MEVRCSSCSTEYEFDDALVSARGTSVKCTNCGHQFRVHPVGAANAAVTAAAETWVVRDAAGKLTTFTSLRDLQQGIVRGHIDPKHELSHGGQAFRPMQDIYELQTFFATARQRRQPAPRTLLGVGKDGAPVVGGAQPGVARDGTSTQRASSPPPRRKPDAVHPVQQDRVTPVAGVPAVQTPEARASMPTPNLRGPADSGRPAAQHASSPRHEPPHHEPQHQPGSPQADARADAPAPRSRRERDTDPPSRGAAALPWQRMDGLHGDEPTSEDYGIRRGVGSRWIVALVVIGGLALIGGTVGRDYFLGFIRPQAEQTREDARIPGFLEQARAALGRGDFDIAHAELQKARAVSATDVKTLVATAKLAVARAERTKLLLTLGEALEPPPQHDDKPPAALPRGPGAPLAARKKAEEVAAEAAATIRRAEDKKLLEATLQTQLADAKVAVVQADKLAAIDADILRAKVDLARLDGQLEEARTLVGNFSAQASDPDNAFSLGALDLAEGPAGYASAVDRLRVAARAEEAHGKARALLIQALIGNGDVAGGRAELDKLAALAPQHPALPPLRSIVEAARARAAETEAKADKTKEAAAAPRRAPEPRAARPASAASDTEEAGADDSPIGRASSLHRQGDLAGAEKAYKAIVDQNPNSIPALSGLGDIARQRQQTAMAASYYDRILEQDRNHLPSLMARGDIYWHSGNRMLAVSLYRRALSQVGSSDPLGKRALRRIEEFDKGGTAPAGTGEASGEVPATDEAGRAIPPTPAPSPEAPSPEDQEPEDDGEEPREVTPSTSSTSNDEPEEPPPPEGPIDIDEPAGESAGTP
jgi:predicted Zn finger-like uncharacterized protein